MSWCRDCRANLRRYGLTFLCERCYREEAMHPAKRIAVWGPAIVVAFVGLLVAANVARWLLR
jgi:hypothetical protein